MAWFNKFAQWSAKLAGSAWAFMLAILSIMAWLVTGPMFDWSDTWQLICNTGTTVITYILVFLIQNAQNRDTMAIQKKLDELIKIHDEADDKLIGIEKTAEACVETK